MSDERKCDLFISYSSKDEAWAREFAQVLKQAGVRPWIDSDVPPGDVFEDRMEDALRSSRTMALILSGQSVEGPSTYFEIGAALADNKRIIPIVIDDSDASKIPTLIRKYQPVRDTSPQRAGERVAEALGAHPVLAA